MNKRIRSGLLAAAMVGGGLVGATQLVGNVSAQSYDEPPAVEPTVEPTSDPVQPLVAQVDDADTDPPVPDGAEEAEGEHCGRGGRGGGRGLDTAAEAIGIEIDELREGAESGLTIAQIAGLNGVSAQSVIDAMVEDLAQHLEDEVAEGDLTEAEAAERLEDSVERITTRVNEVQPDRPERPAEAGENEG